MLEVFWIRDDKALMHAYTVDDGDHWVTDALLDGNADAVPQSVTAISRDSGSMLAAWTSNRGSLEVSRFEGIGWIRQQVLPPNSMPKNTKIAAISISSGMMNLFYVGHDGLVYQSYWTSKMRWDRWETTRISNLPAALGGISAISMNSNHMEIFWTSPSGTLHHAYWTSASGRWISEAVPGSAGNTRCEPGSHITTVARKDKSSIEGWCRSIEGYLTHFYYYAN